MKKREKVKEDRKKGGERYDKKGLELKKKKRVLSLLSNKLIYLFSPQYDPTNFHF